MTEQRLADYLTHILTAIERIEVIGEASHRIGIRFPEFAGAHPELPVTSAYQMRNAVAHGYFEIDLEIVWRTITDDLPKLRELVRSLAGDL